MSPGPVRRGSYIKLSATVAPGAGGGAVLDARGRLVGIVFGADTPPPGRRGPIRWESRRPGGKEGATGYRFEYHDPDGPEASGDEEPTIPPEISMHLLEALHRSGAGGGVSYAVPAVLVRHVAEEILRTGSVRRGWVGVKIEETEPGEVRLLSVVPGSPAERAGLRPGDRIVSFGLGASPVEPLTSSALLVDGIAASVPGTPMSLGIRREERSLKVALVLGESPRTPATRPAPGMLPRVPPLHRPTLGVEVDQVDDAVRHRLGVPEGIGLIVLKVRDDSRAAEAGMKEGDTIVEAMGSPIRTLIDLRAALQRQGGSGMVLKVIRDRRELVLDVPPPPEPPAAPAPPVPPAPAPRAKRSPRSGS